MKSGISIKRSLVILNKIFIKVYLIQLTLVRFLGKLIAVVHISRFF